MTAQRAQHKLTAEVTQYVYSSPTTDKPYISLQITHHTEALN